MKRKPSEADILMWDQLRELGGPHYLLEKEYPFAKMLGRKWRFDFALIQPAIAVEIEGGIWNHGAHVRGKHFESDMSKYNEAVRLGWRVLRFSTKQVLDGSAIAFIKLVLDS